MKKLCAFFLVLVLIFSFTSCDEYRSSYNATMLIRSANGEGCEVKFGSLDGTLTMKTKIRDKEADGKLHYDAELGEGELSVYYDVNGTKELLFTIKGGENLEGSGGEVAYGDKITFIIETVGKAKNGEIDIEFE